VAEDLDRGRVYLPADELAAFGVDYGLLAWCRAHQRTDPRSGPRWPASTPHLAIYRSRGRDRDAPPGVRPCVATALTLYSEILNRIEDSDFAVFAHRARVGQLRRVGSRFRTGPRVLGPARRAPAAPRRARPDQGYVDVTGAGRRHRAKGAS